MPKKIVEFNEVNQSTFFFEKSIEHVIDRVMETRLRVTQMDDLPDVKVLFDAALKDSGDTFTVPHLSELRDMLESDPAYVETVALEKAMLWHRISCVAAREKVNPTQ